VLVCLSLLADALSGDGKDDDKGVMCWWNGRSSLCVFLLFLCFPVGCLSLVALPPSQWRSHVGTRGCPFKFFKIYF